MDTQVPTGVQGVEDHREKTCRGPTNEDNGSCKRAGLGAQSVHGGCVRTTKMVVPFFYRIVTYHIFSMYTYMILCFVHTLQLSLLNPDQNYREYIKNTLQHILL